MTTEKNKGASNSEKINISGIVNPASSVEIEEMTWKVNWIIEIDSSIDTTNIQEIINIQLLTPEEYKVPQFNFLKIVWEFISFLESNEVLESSAWKNSDSHNTWERNLLKETSWIFKTLVERFLWEEDYKEVINFFKENPINSEVGRDTLEKEINSAASDIDFSKLSFISWIIERLNKNFEEYKETLSKESNEKEVKMNFEEIFIDSIWELLMKLDEKRDITKTENILYTELDYWSKSDDDWNIESSYINYKFIRDYLDSLNWHAWIVQLLTQKWMINNSWLLNKNERIKDIRPKAILLPWNNITLERKWNTIQIKDTDNWKIYSQSKTKKEVYTVKKPSWKGVEVWKEIWEYNEENIMHDEVWFYNFSKSIQRELCNNRMIPLDSWLLEHIWFRLLNWLIWNDETVKELKTISNNKKLDVVNFSNLKWIFASVEELHSDPDFNNLIKENPTPIIKVTSARPARWPIKVDIEVITNDNQRLIWEYRIMVA